MVLKIAISGRLFESNVMIFRYKWEEKQSGAHTREASSTDLGLLKAIVSLVVVFRPFCSAGCSRVIESDVGSRSLNTAASSDTC